MTITAESIESNIYDEYNIYTEGDEETPSTTIRKPRHTATEEEIERTTF